MDMTHLRDGYYASVDHGVFKVCGALAYFEDGDVVPLTAGLWRTLWVHTEPTKDYTLWTLEQRREAWARHHPGVAAPW
jgi:hypothetical protein